jgi:hypothetical protein
MAAPEHRPREADSPTPDTSNRKVEVLSTPATAVDIVRLFHREGDKPPEDATDLLRQALAVNGAETAAVLLTGAGFVFVELPSFLAYRYPDAEEYAGVVRKAQQVADTLRQVLPTRRPLVVVGIDVYGWVQGVEMGSGVGQFAAVLPVDGPTLLLPKRFPTVEEEKFLRIPDTDDHPQTPVVDTAHGGAAVLVCHDLNVYHPRSVAVTSREDRRGWRSAFTAQLSAARPAFGLHLAHYVASERSFLQGNSGWRKAVGVPLFGGAGLPADVTPDRARELAASLLSDADGWAVLDLLERPTE